MKHAIFITLLLSLIGGCQTAPPPAPGSANLQVQVVAEPKTGVVTGNTHVLSYDAPVAAPKGQFEKVDYLALDDIVVWLEPVDADNRINAVWMPATNPAPVNAILPNVTPIDVNVDPQKPADSINAAVGPAQSILFHNTSGTSMNLYSVSDGNEFDLGVLPAGGSAQYGVKSPGLIEVLTDKSKDPVALIYVAPSIARRLAHAGETVSFSDLPPGEYKITSWHPRLPGQSVTITLPANQTTSATIKVGVNNLPRIDGH